MNQVLIESANNVLTFKGVLTFKTSAQALEKVRKLFPKSGSVCLDFGGITKSDSSALALVTELMRRSRARNFELKVKNIPKKMMDLARVSGLDSILPFQE